MLQDYLLLSDDNEQRGARGQQDLHLARGRVE